MPGFLDEAARLDRLRLHADVRRVRVLTLDIETMYADVAGTFGQWQQNFPINKIISPVRVIAVAAKWLGEPAVVYTEWGHGQEGMLRATHDLITEADVIVTYNGDNFDTRHLQWEFARLGWARPRPFKSIDLLKVVRRNFRPMSNKLDFVAQQLGVGSKVHHEGIDLWTKVSRGDERARAKMVRYAKGDVNLTEKLYLRLLPWLPAGVNLPLIAGNDSGCPVCGSPKLKSRGESAFTALTEYALYQCAGCGSWVRSNVVRNRTTRRIVR